MMCRLKDVMHGFIHGQKSERKGGTFGSARVIFKLKCRHLKREGKTWLKV